MRKVKIWYFLRGRHIPVDVSAVKEVTDIEFLSYIDNDLISMTIFNGVYFIKRYCAIVR